MEFMGILKATQRSEAGVPLTNKEIQTMIQHNQEMAQAGVLLDAAGIVPSSSGD